MGSQQHKSPDVEPASRDMASPWERALAGVVANGTQTTVRHGRDGDLGGRFVCVAGGSRDAFPPGLALTPKEYKGILADASGLSAALQPVVQGVGVPEYDVALMGTAYGEGLRAMERDRALDSVMQTCAALERREAAAREALLACSRFAEPQIRGEMLAALADAGVARREAYAQALAALDPEGGEAMGSVAATERERLLKTSGDRAELHAELAVCRALKQDEQRLVKAAQGEMDDVFLRDWTWAVKQLDAVKKSWPVWERSVQRVRALCAKLDVDVDRYGAKGGAGFGYAPDKALIDKLTDDYT